MFSFPLLYLFHGTSVVPASVRKTTLTKQHWKTVLFETASYVFSVFVQQLRRSKLVFEQEVIARFHGDNVYVDVEDDLSRVCAVVLHDADGSVTRRVLHRLRNTFGYLKQVSRFVIRHLIDVCVMLLGEQPRCAQR